MVTNTVGAPAAGFQGRPPLLHGAGIKKKSNTNHDDVCACYAAAICAVF
ncbi:MAG: hypothetical protein KKA10_01850 [Euryarchaeota archaeon]|nr:hypothetical protein [Euryarchaeota archaeon]MCG2737423.1 hypothetical protein [Candidatus Methanoperedenaceae archaeon]